MTVAAAVSATMVGRAPVAQPDRVVASEAIGRGFESLQARHFPWDRSGTNLGQLPTGLFGSMSTSLRPVHGEAFHRRSRSIRTVGHAVAFHCGWCSQVNRAGWADHPRISRRCTPVSKRQVQAPGPGVPGLFCRDHIHHPCLGATGGTVPPCTHCICMLTSFDRASTVSSPSHQAYAYHANQDLEAGYRRHGPGTGGCG